MAQDAVQTKKPIGRPSKYRKEYCQQIIDSGRRGETLVHFACDIMVTKDTLLEWASKHEDFSVALKIAKQLNEAYWLNLANSRGAGLHQGSDTIIKFMLSSAHGYREASDVNQTVTADVTLNGKVDITFVDINP